jgi:hypothetical protein
MSPEAHHPVLAAVVFEGPHGADGYLLSEGTGSTVPFGRAAQCPIRFGHSPKPDLRLARHAGTFLVAGDRLVIEGAPQEQSPPLRICVPGRPPFDLPPGEAYGPSAVEYDVVVRGERDWTMQVRTRARTPVLLGDPSDPPTDRRPLRLSEHQRTVLNAYVAPLRAGRLEPSTHAEVAEELAYSINKTRRDLYQIWQLMVTGGVVVPEYGDKRVAVAQAALSHGLA